MSEPLKTWTVADFEQLTWHDNHVHGLRIVEGEHGCGELILDIDHVVEWLLQENGLFHFRLAPATLTFHEVSRLRIEIDYVTVTAGIVPFSLLGIRREPVIYSTEPSSFRWCLAIGWPQGEIRFESPRFTQVLRAGPVMSTRQSLEPAERA